MTKINESKDLKGKSKVIEIEEIIEDNNWFCNYCQKEFTENISPFLSDEDNDIDFCSASCLDHYQQSNCESSQLDIKKEVAKIDKVYSYSETGEGSSSNQVDLNKVNLELITINQEITEKVREGIESNSYTDDNFKITKVLQKNWLFPDEYVEAVETSLDLDELKKLITEETKAVPMGTTIGFTKVKNINLKELIVYTKKVEDEVKDRVLSIYREDNERKDNFFLTKFGRMKAENEIKVNVLNEKLEIIRIANVELQNTIRETEERDRIFTEQREQLIASQENLTDIQSRYNVLFARWEMENNDLGISRVHINSLNRQIQSKQAEIERWKARFENQCEETRVEAIVSVKQRDLMIKGKFELERLNKKIARLEDEKTNLLKKLEEEINKKSIFNGTYQAISSTINKPINFVKDYAGNWILEKIWLGIYLVLFLVNLFIFLTQSTWKLFFTLIYSTSLFVIKNYFPAVSLQSNFIYSFLITIAAFITFYSLKWLKKLFIYTWKRASEKFGKNETITVEKDEIGLDKSNLTLENYFEKVRNNEEILDLEVIEKLLKGLDKERL